MNLIVTLGSKNSLSYTNFDTLNKEEFQLLHYKSDKRPFDIGSSFFSSVLLRDLFLLNKAGVDKAEIEIQQFQLFNKVIFIHLDYLLLYRDLNETIPIDFSNIEFTDNFLYSTKYTNYPHTAKNLIFPSIYFWACSSNTFNILSCITPEVLLKGKIKWDIGLDSSLPSQDIFTNYEVQFWNYLGAMGIDICAL